MPLVGGRSGRAIRHRTGSIPSSGARRSLPTNSRHAKWPASPRSPKSVGPESFSVPERVHRAGCLVQPGVQPESGLVVSQSGRRDSNPRRPAWEAGILPLNYARVREGRGTINRDIQNCLGRIDLNLIRPVNLTFARSISNIGFEVRAVRRSCLAKPPGVLNPLALADVSEQKFLTTPRTLDGPPGVYRRK